MRLFLFSQGKWIVSFTYTWTFNFKTCFNHVQFTQIVMNMWNGVLCYWKRILLGVGILKKQFILLVHKDKFKCWNTQVIQCMRILWVLYMVHTHTCPFSPHHAILIRRKEHLNTFDATGFEASWKILFLIFVQIRHASYEIMPFP